MRRIQLSIGAVLLGLCCVGGWIVLRQEKINTAEDPAATTRNATYPEFRRKLARNESPIRSERTKGEVAPQKSEFEALRQELASARVELERISRPFSEDVLSSTVRTELEPGESLITGGYRTGDGNYEMTFLTPKLVRLDDGSEAIDIEAKVIAVGPEFVAANGLETITTNARNTIQHAEVWKSSDVKITLDSVRDSEGATLRSSPRVRMRPSSDFAITTGDRDGQQYSLEGTIGHGSNGGFLIDSRIERKEAEASGVNGG